MKIKELVIASIFFLVLTVIFFHKVFFGLIPLPTDLIVGAYYPWLNEKWGYDVGVPVKNGKLSDAVSIYYPLRALAHNFVKKGELPLWNPHMFGGYPLFANVQLSLLFPTVIFYSFLSTHYAWTIQVMFQPFLGCLFMYFLLRHFELDKLPSIFGSIAFGFGAFITSWMQWNTQATTSLFLPILILFLDKYLDTKQIKWGVLFSIFICLQIFAGYLPIIQFTYLSLAIFYLFKTKKSFSDFKIGLFFILGVGLSSIFTLPVAELILLSQRQVETLGGQDPFTSWENFLNFISPDFFGNDATGNFWGKGDHMDFTLFAGVTTLILSTFSLKLFFKNPQVRFAVSLFIVAVIISSPNPISQFLYNLGLWGGSSMTMNRVNFMVNFSLALLAAFGLSQIKISKIYLRPLFLTFAAVFGIVLGLLISRHLLITTITALPNHSVDSSIGLSHTMISLRNMVIPSLLVTGIIALFLIMKKFKIFRPFLEVLLIFLLIFELFRLGLKFNTFAPPKYIYPQNLITQFLQKHPNDRFIAEEIILPANMWVPFNISSIGGYDGIYPLNAAKLLAVANSSNIDSAPQPRWGILRDFNSKIIDNTNSKYLLALKTDDNGYVSPTGQVNFKLREKKFKKIFEDKGVAILENTTSLPRAYLTRNVVKSSDRETLKALLNEKFPISSTSITSDFEFKNTSNEKLDSKADYSQISNTKVQVKTQANMEAFLVVLDSFYPGWKAFIDGKETKIYKTNFSFRGVLLPKGNHTVEFIYQPKSLQYGATISGLSLLIVFALLGYHFATKKSLKF